MTLLAISKLEKEFTCASTNHSDHDMYMGTDRHHRQSAGPGTTDVTSSQLPALVCLEGLQQYQYCPGKEI